MKRLLIAMLGLALLCSPAVHAQGFLVNADGRCCVPLPRPIIIIEPPYPWPYPWPYPRPIPRPQPEQTYKIKELKVDANIDNQIAKVQVSQSFVNTGSQQMEVSFVFPLPYDGAIDRLTLMVDGKEYEAKLLSAKEARKQYEEIVRQNKDPALLEWLGTGMFKTSVFPVPAGAERTVTLRYSQLLRKSDGLTDFSFPLSTAKYTSHPVEAIKFRVRISSDTKIKNIYSPSHDVDIKRDDNKHAAIEYEAKNKIPTEDFRLFYDAAGGKLSAKVLTYRPDKDEDGYFLLLASPDVKAAEDDEPARKTVIFVVDRSGSMSGKKIDQAKEALKFVLNNLKQGDTFNIIAYDSEIESFRPELQKYDDDSRKAALRFIEGIYAGGSTNIDGALKTALNQLNDEERPSYVLFLTDGLPTTGETNEAKIAQGVEQANDVRARLFTFGVGYDVNSKLLDKLVRENFGQGVYVRPNEDIEERVSTLYNKIGSPVLTQVELNWEIDDVDQKAHQIVNRVYPSDNFDLFAGDQLVVAGRYKHAGDAKVTIRGKVGDEKQTFDFPAKLTKKSNDDSHAFVEKLWAVRRVGEILDEIDLKGKNDELVDELVQLATKHGILTPYTSFLADENGNVRDLAENRRQAGNRLDALRAEQGQGAFAQRSGKQSLKMADRAAAPAAEGFFESDAFGAVPGAGGPRFGGGVGGVGRPAGGQAGEAVAAEPPRQKLFSVGGKTFYRQDDRWVDSAVQEADEKKAQQVDRYSSEYFALADKYGDRVAKYLAIDAPVVFQIDDETFFVK